MKLKLSKTEKFYIVFTGQVFAFIENRWVAADSADAECRLNSLDMCHGIDPKLNTQDDRLSSFSVSAGAQFSHRGSNTPTIVIGCTSNDNFALQTHHTSTGVLIALLTPTLSPPPPLSTINILHSTATEPVFLSTAV
ncbi:hypothetical protein O9993_00785 [Vibrio lentus]|nr:hypothetical protein [Vibrio lentus]